MSVVKFTETVFSNSGKKGVLVPDEDGYYEVVVGGLNTINSSGEYYAAERAVALFNTSSTLMRRIKNGALYAELGHPKRHPGMSLDDYYCRIISIEETNICGHFSEITLDPEFGRKHPELNSPNMIAILAKVKPSGAKASALESSLANPKENTSFSIRALCDIKNVGGRNVKTLTNVITFDHVTEGGLQLARKHYAPTVESHKESPVVTELSETLVDRETLMRVLSKQDSLVTMEGSRELYNELISSISPKKTKSRLSDW